MLHPSSAIFRTPRDMTLWMLKGWTHSYRVVGLSHTSGSLIELSAIKLHCGHHIYFWLSCIAISVFFLSWQCCGGVLTNLCNALLTCYWAILLTLEAKWVFYWVLCHLNHSLEGFIYFHPITTALISLGHWQLTKASWEPPYCSHNSVAASAHCAAAVHNAFHTPHLYPISIYCWHIIYSLP